MKLSKKKIIPFEEFLSRFSDGPNNHWIDPVVRQMNLSWQHVHCQLQRMAQTKYITRSIMIGKFITFNLQLDPVFDFI